MSSVAAVPSFLITASAARRISEICAASGASAGLRVEAQGGGCSGYRLMFAVEDAPDSDDCVFEEGSARVFIDPASLVLMLGSRLDWAEELIGASFRLDNPLAGSSCGCGASFGMASSG